MEATKESAKALQKHNVSWFEFLFDTTGDLLKRHLRDASAEPSAPQLIVQFLEHSGLLSISLSAASEVPPNENKRAQRLCRLALRVAAYLEWNLEFLEENLSLQWQDFLLGELMKASSSLEGIQVTEIELGKLDPKSAMTLVIYYRWVVRTLAQHFLPYITKPMNNGMSAEYLGSENILRKLEEELPAAIHILEQALEVSDDMDLPGVPSLLLEPKQKDEGEQTNSPSVNEGEDYTMGDENADESIKADGFTNGKDESSWGSATEFIENLEVSKVKKDDIVAQVSFDLGTLFFYQEKFEQARKMFESCKNAKCSRSAFYTVDEMTLTGYCMACGDLPSCAACKTSETSLTMKLEHCRRSGYQDLVHLLVEDNIMCELPIDVRDNLLTELRIQSKKIEDDDEEREAEGVALDWQVMVCNTIRDVIDGRPVQPVFWLSLKSCSQHQLENIFSLCSQSIPFPEGASPETVKDNSRFKELKSFVHLISCHCEQMNGWEIARASMARLFVLDEEEMLVEAEKEKEATDSPPVDIKHPSKEVFLRQESPELRKGFLCNKLRHTVDPDEISTIVEQLYQLEKGKRQSEEFFCMLYKSHLEEIKNPQQQDILHIIFSKAMQCLALQEYNQVSQLLSYALGMVNSVSGRGSSGGSVERVKSAIHQELLILDICQESNVKRSDELLNKAKMYIKQTTPGLAELHVEEQVTVFLLNGREWEFLSDLKVDESCAQSLDHRLLSSLLASTCYFLSKPQGWRKPARSLWDGMLKVFSNTGQQKRPGDGGQGVMVIRNTGGIKLSNLIKFVCKMKEETVLTILISCLVRLHNAYHKSDESNNRREISSSHSHLWPTTITNPSSINFNHIGLALLGVVHHAISLQHHNTSWLQTLADIYLDSGNYSSALRCYLESGAVSSSYFNSPVPSSVWDDQTYRKMVTCCSALKGHIQSALLCQCMEVKDYTTAFKALQQASLASSDAMDLYYPFFWDVTMLEYLVYIHAKRGQNDKKQLAVQAISQPELNIFNSSELLQHTEQTRRTKLFRTLAKQYL